MLVATSAERTISEGSGSLAPIASESKHFKQRHVWANRPISDQLLLPYTVSSAIVSSSNQFSKWMTVALFVSKISHETVGLVWESCYTTYPIRARFHHHPPEKTIIQIRPKDGGTILPSLEISKDTHFKLKSRAGSRMTPPPGVVHRPRHKCLLLQALNELLVKVRGR